MRYNGRAMAQGHEDRERVSEGGTKQPYERFGWRFSGGLLALRPVSEAMDRLVVALENAVALLKARRRDR